METDLKNQVVVNPEMTNSRMPRRSLDLLNIQTPELKLLSPLRSEIAPKGLARAKALVSYSERLRNSYRANDGGLRAGMKLLAETISNGQPIAVSCFCRAGEMCHADVVKLAIEKVQHRVLIHENAKKQAEQLPLAAKSLDIPNPRTQRAINEILSVSKSDLLLARLDQTDGRSQNEHASYLNQHSQFARDLYERGAMVSGNSIIVPKERLSLSRELEITTNEHAVKKLEQITPDRSKAVELAPKVVEYGKKIAGSDADRETQLKVFNWIYRSLEGKTEFLDSKERTVNEETKHERFERTMNEIATLAHELSQLEPPDYLVSLDELFDQRRPNSTTEEHDKLLGDAEIPIREQMESVSTSQPEFERFDVGNVALAQMASKMSQTEREHWFNVRLPAIDKELENGKPVEEILKACKDNIYIATVHEPSRKGEAIDDLKFATAYIDNQLKHPDSRLRHFNPRYRRYAAMLNKATTRIEVIESASEIRSENARAGLSWENLSANEKSATTRPLTAKELQFLFTEAPPKHYTSDMSAARISYSHFGASRSAMTLSLTNAEFKPSPEAQKLLESLEMRLNRRDIRDSVAATKHFMLSLNTPASELKYKNEVDHHKMYSLLPPHEKDAVYARAIEQKNDLEARIQKGTEPQAQEISANPTLFEFRAGVISDLVNALENKGESSHSLADREISHIVTDKLKRLGIKNTPIKETINSLRHELNVRLNAHEPTRMSCTS